MNHQRVTEKNQTLAKEFFLLGFQNLQNFRIPVFSLFLLIYLLTICENILIIVLVSTSHHLRSPMYFFLQCLSMCDLVETTIIVPILLSTVINGGTIISFPGCITQLYFFCVSEAFQCLLLSVMSYDRYLAICNPLRYTSIMNHRECVKFIFVPLVLCSVFPILSVTAISRLKFCTQNAMNHFFCDFSPLLDLSCLDISLVQIEIILLSLPFLLFPFIFIIVSYIQIVRSILQITSSTGRQKAFSTCSSHLSVVSMFYGTLSSIYAVPHQKQSLTMNKILSLLYTVLIPFINPLVYTLRNKDIKEAVKMYLDKIITIKKP